MPPTMHSKLYSEGENDRKKLNKKGEKNRQDGLYESHKRWLSNVLEKTK